METLKKYRQIVKNVIVEIGERKNKSSKKDIRYQVILDEETGNYILLRNGWKGIDRFYSNIIHVEVAFDSKIWIHQDNTDLIIADILLEKGVLEKDIILAFHAPIMR
jgi:XisI protein